MSTLTSTDLTVADANITTLKDASGGNSSIPADIFEGRAKAWCNLNGVGTPAFRDSFNCASITDNAAADHTINLTDALPNANYAVLISTGTLADGSGHQIVTLHRINSTGVHVPPTTSAFRYSSANTGAATTESAFITCVVFCGA